MISVDYSLFRMQLDDCSVAYPDLIPWIMCCAMAAIQAENHFHGRGVRIQDHPWPRASLLEGTVCSRVKCFGIESKQICIPWKLHRSTRNKETPLTVNEVLQWRDLPGGTTSRWKSATPVQCKLSVPDLRHFYLERLTTSLPHNRTVCFS